jgi:hypothetical protein
MAPAAPPPRSSPATSSPAITRPVYIAAQTMTTDFPSSFEEHSMIALQHNLGLGGACVVTMYRRD